MNYQRMKILRSPAEGPVSKSNLATQVSCKEAEAILVGHLIPPDRASVAMG